jgi:hypothetical protein
MTEPLVCCICPSHLPGFMARAQRCFDSQTYPNKLWLPMDTRGLLMTVGAIRNSMLRHFLPDDAQIIAHFDHDDWSSPVRLEEQVAFMQASGADIVGYHDMPFYDVDRDKVLLYSSNNPHYAVGTSLLYKREVWGRVPFPDQTDEDTTWQNMVGPSRVASVSSLYGRDPHKTTLGDVPRMVQTIHKRNGSPKVGARFQPASAELGRAVREILAREPIPAG